MFTCASAYELGPYGVRVNAVAPGLIWREGLDRAWPEGVVRYQRSAPWRRLGTAEDVADACLFLASPAVRWITGASLIVDGRRGRHLRTHRRGYLRHKCATHPPRIPQRRCYRRTPGQPL
jgi:Dehydrogenases with different specificities (related to short-chain alcohol dehydrogenases)